MTKTKRTPLPPGWRDDKDYDRTQYVARREAIAKVPRRRAAVLALDWAWAALRAYPRPVWDRCLDTAEGWMTGRRRTRPGLERAWDRYLVDWLDSFYQDGRKVGGPARGVVTACHGAVEVAWEARTDEWATFSDGSLDGLAARGFTTAAEGAAHAAPGGWAWVYATYVRARGSVKYAFDPIWKTDTTVALAKVVVKDRQFDLGPVLGDALEDAGCCHPPALACCRGPADLWTRADRLLSDLLS